jgi:acetyl-CoA synthetase
MDMKKLRPKSYEEFLQTFRMDVPENYNFAFDLVDRIAHEEPGRPAMVHVDPEGNRREFDFAWFSAASSRLANALTAQGIGKGDRVMLILYRRMEFWVAMLALHKIGALPIPSPSLLTVHDIEYRVNFAGIKGAIVEDSISSRVVEAAGKCPSLTRFVQVGASPLPEGWSDFDAICAKAPDRYDRPAGREAPGGRDPMVIFFSSGTTGNPKMVLHNYTYPLAHYTTAAYWHDIEPGDLHLTLSDTGWAKSVWGKFYGQWMAGGVIFVWDFRGKFEPKELLGMLARHQVNTFCAPPTVYRFLVREDLSAYDLSKLRYCTTAGELLNDSVFLGWQKSTGLDIHEGYGQTETTLQLATYPWMTPKPGSIGKPSPGWDLVLLDPDGNPVSSGEEGEICIRLKDDGVLGLFDGYLDEPDRTAKVVVDGYYHTGDKAWIDEDGYYWFLGRTDDLIKSSGYRIGPFEVESALVAHEAVIEAAVTGIPDPVRGMAVKATVVLAPGFTGDEALTKTLQDHVKKVTAPYKYPRVIEYVAELPKTISGKIKRGEIRERDLEKMKAGK